MNTKEPLIQTILLSAMVLAGCNPETQQVPIQTPYIPNQPTPSVTATSIAEQTATYQPTIEPTMQALTREQIVAFNNNPDFWLTNPGILTPQNDDRQYIGMPPTRGSEAFIKANSCVLAVLTTIRRWQYLMYTGQYSDDFTIANTAHALVGQEYVFNGQTRLIYDPSRAPLIDFMAYAPALEMLDSEHMISVQSLSNQEIVINSEGQEAVHYLELWQWRDMYPTIRFITQNGGLIMLHELDSGGKVGHAVLATNMPDSPDDPFMVIDPKGDGSVRYQSFVAMPYVAYVLGIIPNVP